jgi:hypothetical protein
MKNIRSALAALFMLFAATFAYSQQAGVCAGYVPSGSGLTDGCSVPGVATWIFPDVGVFKSTFTPACVNHDHCYSSLGSNYSECNGNFLSDMQSACSSTYTVLSGPVYLACMSSASEYYSAVVAYSAADNPLGGIQQDALLASRNLQTQVNTDACATTPQLSNLYDSSVVNLVNNAFQNYAHRLPTIYEFMDTVNDGDLTADRTGWINLVNQHAIAAATVAPPSVAVTYFPPSSDFYVTTPTTGAQYTWSFLTNMRASGTSIVPIPHPVYSTTYTVGGILRASIVVNGATVRNQYILQNENISIYGSCGPVKGGPCV